MRRVVVDDLLTLLYASARVVELRSRYELREAHRSCFDASRGRETPMNRGGITALGLALGLVALFGVGRVLAFETAVDHADHDHQFVRITSSHLSPQMVRVGSGEALAWVNYSRQIARISFEKDVATKMECRSRGSFRIVGDRLESNDIQGQQFASLCSLAAGTYAYRVALFDSSGANIPAPARMLEGSIAVK